MNTTQDVLDKTLFSKTPNKIHKCAKMTKNISTIQMDICPDRRICAFMCHLLFNLDIKSNKKKKKRNYIHWAPTTWLAMYCTLLNMISFISSEEDMSPFCTQNTWSSEKWSNLKKLHKAVPHKGRIWTQVMLGFEVHRWIYSPRNHI